MSLFDSIGKIIVPESSRPYIKDTKLKEHKDEFTDPKDVFASTSETTKDTKYSLNPEYNKGGVINIPENTSELVQKKAVLKSGTVITDDFHGVTITHPDGSSNKYPGELFLNHKQYRYYDTPSTIQLKILNGNLKEDVDIFPDGKISDTLRGQHSGPKSWCYEPDKGYCARYMSAPPVVERNDGSLQLDLSDSYGWGGNVMIFKPAISKQDVTPTNKGPMRSTDSNAMDKMLISDNHAKNNKAAKPSIKNRFLPL